MCSIVGLWNLNRETGSPEERMDMIFKKNID